MMAKRQSVKTRLFRSFIPEPNSGCWLWCLAEATSGYGKMQVGVKTCLAHRVSWELHFGEIPKGLYVCHTCDTKLCINPDHLFLGTAKDNWDDMVTKGRRRFAIGADCGAAKLNESQVLDIYGDGRIHREIAADYGVSREAVSRIKQGRSWKWLTSRMISKTHKPTAAQ